MICIDFLNFHFFVTAILAYGFFLGLPLFFPGFFDLYLGSQPLGMSKPKALQMSACVGKRAAVGGTARGVHGAQLLAADPFLCLSVLP